MRLAPPQPDQPQQVQRVRLPRVGRQHRPQGPPRPPSSRPLLRPGSTAARDPPPDVAGRSTAHGCNRPRRRRRAVVDGRWQAGGPTGLRPPDPQTLRTFGGSSGPPSSSVRMRSHAYGLGQRSAGDGRADARSCSSTTPPRWAAARSPSCGWSRPWTRAGTGRRCCCSPTARSGRPWPTAGVAVPGAAAGRGGRQHPQGVAGRPRPAGARAGVGGRPVRAATGGGRPGVGGGRRPHELAQVRRAGRPGRAVGRRAGRVARPRPDRRRLPAGAGGGRLPPGGRAGAAVRDRQLAGDAGHARGRRPGRAGPGAGGPRRHADRGRPPGGRAGRRRPARRSSAWSAGWPRGRGSTCSSTPPRPSAGGSPPPGSS